MTDAATREVGALPLLDRPVLATLAALLAPADLTRNLATLVRAAEELRVRLGAPGDDAELAGAAHTLAGSGGLLGFARLSAAARRFERAVETGAVDRALAGRELMVTLDETVPAMRAVIGGGELVAVG